MQHQRRFYLQRHLFLMDAEREGERERMREVDVFGKICSIVCII